MKIRSLEWTTMDMIPYIDIKVKIILETIRIFFYSDQAQNLVIFPKHVYFWVPV